MSSSDPGGTVSGGGSVQDVGNDGSQPTPPTPSTAGVGTGNVSDTVRLGGSASGSSSSSTATGNVIMQNNDTIGLEETSGHIILE